MCLGTDVSVQHRMMLKHKNWSQLFGSHEELAVRHEQCLSCLENAHKKLLLLPSIEIPRVCKKTLVLLTVIVRVRKTQYIICSSQLRIVCYYHHQSSKNQCWYVWLHWRLQQGRSDHRGGCGQAMVSMPRCTAIIVDIPERGFDKGDWHIEKFELITNSQ